jgi:hypothetical protein
MSLLAPLKNHLSLVSFQPLISHAKVDVQKRLHSQTKFPLLPLPSSITSHTVIHSPFSSPLLTGQNEIYIRVSNINWNQLITLKRNQIFFNTHVKRNTCTFPDTMIRVPRYSAYMALCHFSSLCHVLGRHITVPYLIDTDYAGLKTIQ